MEAEHEKWRRQFKTPIDRAKALEDEMIEAGLIEPIADKSKRRKGSAVNAAMVCAERFEMDDRWLSVEEIAEHLGVAKDTIYVWLNNKGMPGHKMGRLWKFKKDEVDKWVTDGGAAQTNGTKGEK